MDTSVSGGLFFYVSNDLGVTLSNDAGTGVWDDEWHHIAGTYDGSALRLYVDGTEVGPSGGKPLTKPIEYSDGNLYIGSYFDTYYGTRLYFTGTIDEVHIWNTALSPTQLGSVIVAMDIKPESCPNPLNVNSKGVLPVAILGTDVFDVTQVDPVTVRLEGVAPLRWDWEDVATPYESSGEVEYCMDCTADGPDEFLDITLKFNTQEVVGVIGEVDDRDCLQLTLTGNLFEEFGGTPIVGEDVVLILKKVK